MISTIDEPWGASTCRSSTLAVFVNSDPFRRLILTTLGSQSDFHGCRTPRCAYVLAIKTRSLGQFWPVSWTITQFCGPEVISTIDEPWGAFPCQSSTLTILANSGPFYRLLLTVLGSRAIFMIDDPGGAFTCPSSTLTVLANYVPFRGLLLTVLGSRSDFHSC